MPPQLIALEYVVEDLERVLELLVDLIGLEVIRQERHPTLDAEMVTLELGQVVLTLIHPTADGDRKPVNRMASNLSQLVIQIDEPIAELTRRLGEGGAGVVVDTPAMSHLSLQSTESIFGVAPSLVFVGPDDIDGADTPDGPAGSNDPTEAEYPGSAGDSDTLDFSIAPMDPI